MKTLYYKKLLQNLFFIWIFSIAFTLTANALPAEEGECGKCKGGITSLDFKYLGSVVNATIKVYKDDVKPHKLIATFNGVNTEDILTVTGTGKDKKLGKKIRITVNDGKNYTEIHTSCSQDVLPGMIFGAFEITAGMSKDGGPLCDGGSGGGGPYCISDGTNTYVTGITLVNFNTINNPTPVKTAGYNDYTLQSTEVVQGSSYDLTLKLNTSGNWTIQAYVWIDWNQDYKFSKDEKYDLGTARNSTSGQTSHSPLSITIPGDAALGDTRMRVSCEWDGSLPLGPCDLFNDGEVEDYTITVLEGTTTTPECGECKGGITSLAFKYLGSEVNATIKVYKDDVKPHKLIASFNGVNTEDILTVTGTGKDKKLVIFILTYI